MQNHFEEYSHIKEMIQSGKFTRPEIKKINREKYSLETNDWSDFKENMTTSKR